MVIWCALQPAILHENQSFIPDHILKVKQTPNLCDHTLILPLKIISLSVYLDRQNMLFKKKNSYLLVLTYHSDFADLTFTFYFLSKMLQRQNWKNRVAICLFSSDFLVSREYNYFILLVNYLWNKDSLIYAPKPYLFLIYFFAGKNTQTYTPLQQYLPYWIERLNHTS